MAFQVKDIITEVVEMITPASLFNTQFTKCEVIHNREMAEAQIHDERAIARLQLFVSWHVADANRARSALRWPSAGVSEQELLVMGSWRPGRIECMKSIEREQTRHVR